MRKITDHCWRAPMGSQWAQRVPLLERGCAFMNCRRPIQDHAQTRMPRGKRADTRAARRARGEADKPVRTAA